MAEEGHRPTVRRLLGSIHTTVKEQSRDEARAQTAPSPPTPQLLHRLPATASEAVMWRGLGCCRACAHGIPATLGQCPSGPGSWAAAEVSVQLGNHMSEQVSRDSRSKFTMAPGSGCLNVSFN